MKLLLLTVMMPRDCSLESGRQREKKTSTAGTYLVSLTLFISCIIRPVYMAVFEPHSLSIDLTLSGIKKYGKQLLPDYGKFILFNATNHETGLEKVKTNPFSVMVPPAPWEDASDGHCFLPTKEQSIVDSTYM